MSHLGFRQINKKDKGNETMYARKVTAQVSPEKVAEGLQLWQDSVVPAVKAQKGFKSGRLFVDRKTGKIVTVGLWETEADMQATAGAFVQEQLAKFASLFTAPPVVEHYELAVEA